MTGLHPLACRPINLLFLTKHMDLGGGEYVLRTIVERLDRRAFRPVIACLGEEGRFGAELRGQGVPVHANLARHKLDPLVVPRLLRLVAAENIEAIYLTDYRNVMLWGALTGRLAGIPTILASHSTDWWGRRRRSPSLLGKKLLAWHRRIVVVARFQKEHLIAEEGVPPGIVEVIPNGIDPSRYGTEVDAAVRQSLGVPAEAFVIGTVAVLRKEKNLALLFAALGRLRDAREDVWAVIVGDGTERHALEALCREMGLADRVRFVGYNDRPGGLLPAFDAFTLTSRVEVMPITILEAMACGVPVVATAVGAVPELVAEGETGFVVPSGDANALAARLRRLIRESELRHRMGRAGRERATSLFTLDAMIQGNEALLHAVAGR